MKKTLFLMLVFVLVALPALAAEQKGIHEPGTGLDDPEVMVNGQGTGQGQMDDLDDSMEVENDNEEELILEPTQYNNQQQAQIQQQERTANKTQNQGENSQVQDQVQTRAKNANELKAMIQENRQEMVEEINSMSNKDKQKVFQNQNAVREAVHALLASEDLVGGIGRQVSEIARELDNSVEKTIQAEEEIQTRSKIKTFFFGGDEEAADELEEEVGQNQNRIKELKQLKENCSCQQQVAEVVDEQIQNIEQEQTRLGQLASEQKQKRGVFGWLFGWLK